MKFAWLFNTLLAGILFAGVLGCKKRGDQVLPITDPAVAGKGGLATLKITAQRDSFDIDSCTVYIKYNALVSTGTFDDSASATFIDQKPPAVSFPGLKRGDYFLYVKGWDIIKSKIVTGSLGYTIVKDTTATYNILLPVK